ncbi:MAG: hypothetical protein QOF15_1928, partial [Mycobacterium sp.]|nr:hypothetical protein [Mycobacterium sp.]
GARGIDGRASVRSQLFPGERQPRSPWTADKQLGAEFPLQRPDCRGNTRLHNMQPPGRASEAQVVGDGKKILQLT